MSGCENRGLLLTLCRFRLQTEDDSLQPTIDMLLNISVFAWFGAVCPWVAFRVNEVIPIYRLIFLGILMLLFRRIPVIMGLWKYIPQIDDYQQALFVGFFGPIGVSAIFYLYISLEFLKTIPAGPDGEMREDVRHLGEVMTVVIWFLAICSIVVHGLSVPMGKLGYHTPRVLSQALSTSQDNDEPHIFLHHFQANSGQLRRRRNNDRQPSTGAFRIGRSSANPRTAEDNLEIQSAAEPPRPVVFPETGQNTPTRVGSGPPSREASVMAGKDVSIPSGDTEMGVETAGRLEGGGETVKTA
jgi:sodium/hydrogen antiporter